MYDYLNGHLVGVGEELSGSLYLVIDVQGIGYRVLTPRSSMARLPQLESAVQVYTSLIVREDAMMMAGFLTRQEREVFDLLQSASGVGLKVSLALLSDLSVTDLVMAVISGESKALCAVKGIGPKLGQKIVLELKEKMTKWQQTASLGLSATRSVTQSAESSGLPQAVLSEAHSVLTSLGYHDSELSLALTSLKQTHADALSSWNSEQLLQQWLKQLATQPVS